VRERAEVNGHRPDVDAHDIRVAAELHTTPEDVAEAEAEAPEMAGAVEQIAQDSFWLLHRLRDPRTLLSFVLAIALLIFIFTRFDLDPAEVWQTIRQANPTGAVVLIGHSGAGALLPAAAEAAGMPVAAAVFVYAILPHPGASWFDTAPPVLREQLHGLARDGQLPAWHHWFPPDALTELVPEEDLRRRFIAELPRLPLAYFGLFPCFRGS